ncbi:hypothetical protein M9458_011062, partial [Cirrhinus mrigala]
DESEEGEEEADVAKASPNPPRQPSPPESPLSLQHFPEYASSNQLLMTAEPFEPNGPAAPLLHFLPVLLGVSAALHEPTGGAAYRTLQQEELDLPMETPSFHKLNLIRSVTMQE